MKTISTIHALTLLALAITALTGLLCEAETMIAVIATRIIGLTAALTAHRLYQQWKKTDPLIGAYDRWCEKCDR